MNILLLNDNPVVTKLVTLSAQKTGNEISIAGNIDEILEGSYDLLIVDEALYTPELFGELESKISYKRSLYMLSRGATSVMEFDNEVKKPFLPTDLVELLSSIAISVANVSEKKQEPKIDLDDTLEDDLDLDLHGTAESSEIDSDDLGDLDFDLDSFNLDDMDLSSMDLDIEDDTTNSILDQDDVNEVKNLLDEADLNLEEEEPLDDELKLDELDDDFSFDDLDLEEEPIQEKKEESKIEPEKESEDQLEDDFNLDDFDFEDEIEEKSELEAEEEIEEESEEKPEEESNESQLDTLDESLAIEEDNILDDLMEEDFSLDELEDKIETAVEALSSEDLEQEIDIDLDDLSELASLDEKSLKIALGEEVEEEADELSLDEEEPSEEIEDEFDDEEFVDAITVPSNIEVKNEKTDGVEALKALLKALSNEDVVASLKDMNVNINISFGNNNDK